MGERIERTRMQRQYLSCCLRADGSAVTAPGNPNHDIMGDLAPIDTSPAAGVQIGYDALGNVLTDPNTPEVGRADTLYDSAGNDHITGGAGDDLIYAKLDINQAKGFAQYFKNYLVGNVIDRWCSAANDARYVNPLQRRSV